MALHCLLHVLALFKLKYECSIVAPARAQLAPCYSQSLIGIIHGQWWQPSMPQRIAITQDLHIWAPELVQLQLGFSFWGDHCTLQVPLH